MDREESDGTLIVMDDWRPLRTAPKDGYTCVLLVYERHPCNSFAKTHSGKLKPTYPSDIRVNQGIWDKEYKQWKVWYESCNFEPPSFYFNSGDILAWMPLPPLPFKVHQRMRQKQKAYYKRRHIRWKKQGIIKDL